ncbi:hypothetical protein V494_02929 [Pseudogymnoascus sp. VKM F-4513 (FW-928)]|nr:hypothetical protein V494_02929 [Pseudogymnoascus sp. VKM F-4513 (FW-928)]
MSTSTPPLLPPAEPCMEFNLKIPNIFGYEPELVPGIVFSVLFFGSFVTHFWQTYHYRKWWLLVFVLGAFGELAGWAARTAAHECSYSVQAFQAQLSSLIMAPALTTAGIYTTLAMMIPILGQHTSPLKPKLYLIIFLTIDIISLVVQGVGGALAGQAFGKKQSTNNATTIMVAGIMFQLVSTCIFTTLYQYVLFRGFETIRRNKPLLQLALATYLSVTCMVLRGIYRSMELRQGWRGYLITNERFAIAMEGSPMLIAIVIFNVFHPERLLREAREVRESTHNAYSALELAGRVKVHHPDDEVVRRDQEIS